MAPDIAGVLEDIYGLCLVDCSCLLAAKIRKAACNFTVAKYNYLKAAAELIALLPRDKDE